MVIKPNVLQGVFFWLFGALTATVLVMSAVTLLPFVESLFGAKASYGVFPRLPASNMASLFVLMSSCLVFGSTYSIHRSRMPMTLPTGAKAALFALGVLFNASVCLLAYLWARFFL